MILASFLWLIWGVYKLGRVSFTPLVGGGRGAADAHPLRLRLPRRPRLHRHPVHGAGRVGGGARGGAAAARRAGARDAGARRAAAPGGVGAGRDVLAVGGVEGDLAAADRLRRAGGDRPGRVDADRLRSSPATRCSRCLHTSSSAEDLGRQRTVGELPAAVSEFFTAIVKWPVLAAAVIGLGLAISFAPRRAAVPLALLVSGIFTFALIGAAGASVIERYLAVAAVALLVFARRRAGGLHDGAARAAAHRVDGGIGGAGGVRSRVHRHARAAGHVRLRADLPRRRAPRPRACARIAAGTAGAQVRSV